MYRTIDEYFGWLHMFKMGPMKPGSTSRTDSFTIRKCKQDLRDYWLSLTKMIQTLFNFHCFTRHALNKLLKWMQYFLYVYFIQYSTRWAIMGYHGLVLIWSRFVSDRVIEGPNSLCAESSRYNSDNFFRFIFSNFCNYLGSKIYGVG